MNQIINNNSNNNSEGSINFLNYCFYVSISIFVFTLDILLTFSVISAQPTSSWSSHVPLAGSAPLFSLSHRPAAVTDFNGNLEIHTSSYSTGVPQRQFLNPDGSLTEAVEYPRFQGLVNPVGTPGVSAFSPNGDRVIQWTAANNVSSFLQYYTAEGQAGPNIINMQFSPSTVVFRNNLVIAFAVSTNGSVLAKEWTVESDGTIVPRSDIPILIQEPTTGCGAAVGINSDGSAVAIFKLGTNIRTAKRSSSGVWTVDPSIVDTQVNGCLTGGSSPQGRVVAAWYKLGYGIIEIGDNIDRGGEVVGLVREPGQDFPIQKVVFHQAPRDTFGNSTRRAYGVTVAIGLDGTAGVAAFTSRCLNQVAESVVLLRLAGPSENFTETENLVVPNTNSSADVVASPQWSATASPVLAVENKRALVAVSTSTFPGVGTSTSPTCGQSSGPPLNTILRQSFASIIDRNTGQIHTALIGSEVRQTDQPTIPGNPPLRELVAGALDFAGNAALVLGRTPSFLSLAGQWQSNGGNITNSPDSDGDGVSDAQELIDGTNPNDPGSFLSKLPKKWCSEWNGFLGMFN
ncbi:MAG TPA: thrombospondin type 3 repeat-containing protein, partial [Oligoflexia bacterium]|nr:thrombospondin type 3 repeat-containing protein [Oligoflexia bacterium]HMP48468.1 thrombospondin type 3 repeat-containing protein [Oligoflexia bacterium]